MIARPRSRILDVAAATVLSFVLFVGAGAGLTWIVGEALDERDKAVARAAIEIILSETRAGAEALADPEAPARAARAADALMVLSVADGRIVAGLLDGQPEPVASFETIAPRVLALTGPGGPDAGFVRLAGGVAAAAYAPDPAGVDRGVVLVVRAEERLRRLVRATLRSDDVAVHETASGGGLALPTPPGVEPLHLVWSAVSGPGPSPLAFVLVIALGFAVLVIATAVLTRSALKREGDADRDRRDLRERTRRDPLTGHGNRARYQEEAQAAVREAAAGGPPVTLVVFDLDHFKSINDRYGHQTGDQVIRHAGRKAAAAIGPAGSVYRLGGDEFVLLLRGLAGEAERAALLDRVAAAIQEPVVVSGVSIMVSASLGAAAAPEHATRADVLEALADRAQYAAKRAGRATWRMTDAAAIEAWRQDRAVEALVRGTIARRETHHAPRLLRDQRTGAPAVWHGVDMSAFERRYRIAPGAAHGLIATLGLQIAADGILLDAVEAEARDGHHLVEMGRETLLDPDTLARLLALAARLAARGGSLTVLLDEADFERRGSSLTDRITALTEGGCRLGVAAFGAGNAALRVALRDEVDAVVLDPAASSGPHAPVLDRVREGLAEIGKRVYVLDAPVRAVRAA